jgi:hypothetical protein
MVSLKAGQTGGIMTAGNPFEIQTRHLSSTRFYHHVNLLGAFEIRFLLHLLGIKIVLRKCPSDPQYICTVSEWKDLISFQFNIDDSSKTAGIKGIVYFCWYLEFKKSRTTGVL